MCSSILHTRPCVISVTLYSQVAQFYFTLLLLSHIAVFTTNTSLEGYPSGAALYWECLSCPSLDGHESKPSGHSFCRETDKDMRYCKLGGQRMFTLVNNLFSFWNDNYTPYSLYGSKKTHSSLVWGVMAIKRKEHMSCHLFIFRIWELLWVILSLKAL